MEQDECPGDPFDSLKQSFDYLRENVESLHIPEEAAYFEALGAGLWALDNGKNHKIVLDRLFKDDKTHFEFLPRLADYENQVTFKTMETGEVEEDDECLIGLDVGSTTTKVVLFRK